METTGPDSATIVGVDIFGPATQDASRLVAFYRDALGMTPTTLDESGQGAEFTLADGTTFGVWQPDQPPKPGGLQRALRGRRHQRGGRALSRARCRIERSVRDPGLLHVARQRPRRQPVWHPSTQNTRLTITASNNLRPDVRSLGVRSTRRRVVYLFWTKTDADDVGGNVSQPWDDRE